MTEEYHFAFIYKRIGVVKNTFQHMCSVLIRQVAGAGNESVAKL